MLNLEVMYPNCVKWGFVYTDKNGEPRLKENQFFESMDYPDCLKFEFEYNCSCRRGSAKLEDVEDFLAKNR